MAKIRSGVEHIAVDTNTAISTRPCIYYGCTVVNATTAGVAVLIYDATATASGNFVDIVTATSGTNSNQGVYYPQGIAMHSGIYASAIVCTSGSDKIVVFYGGV